MAGKHTNPTRPRPDSTQVGAHAPYNFVPLPERMVEAQAPIDHDRYVEEARTGWIDCTLETYAPTYIRGMMTVLQYGTVGQKNADAPTAAEKLELAQFFSVDEQESEGFPVPAIPGSSLRGMIRAVMEIIGHGRMRWVGDEPTFTYRAVAAPGTDPLRQPYQDMLGRFGSNVRAGYLKQVGEAWTIEPAFTPKQVGWSEAKAYLTVADKQISSQAIPGFTRLNSPRYKPGYYKVTFDVSQRQGKRGAYTAITDIGSPETGHKHRYAGTLVCAGNMKESNPQGDTKRKKHALVLPVNRDAKPVPVPDEVVEDYLKGLSPYQRENLWEKEHGCLKDGAPVFYVLIGGRVAAFGHCPNFRVPALAPGSNRAANPLDFVPPALRENPAPDLVDAIFGWVEEAGTGPTGQRAGRVSFGDARFAGANDGVWYRTEPITPHPLSGPKSTTFQHYLVQDASLGHNPDDKASLAHYGTPLDQTQIRGYKRYWHKGAAPDIAATPDEQYGRDTGKEHESQLTRIMPLKPGVRFTFRVHFENLREAELGALLWALTLPGAPNRSYRHKLGMGKPLGMGAVGIEAQVHITHRRARYKALFDDAGWRAGAEAADSAAYITQFERYVLDALGLQTVEHLGDLERIQMLMAMLEWRESDQRWLERTSYMALELGELKRNEYKERPVLPDPLAVAGDIAQRPPRRGPAVQEHHEHPAQPPAQPAAPPVSNDTSLEIGVVKFFNDSKGYGFIARDKGSDIHVHFTGIVGQGRRSLREGQRVRFREGVGQDGRPTAKDVEPV